MWTNSLYLQVCRLAYYHTCVCTSAPGQSSQIINEGQERNKDNTDGLQLVMIIVILRKCHNFQKQHNPGKDEDEYKRVVLEFINRSGWDDWNPPPSSFLVLFVFVQIEKCIFTKIMMGWLKPLLPPCCLKNIHTWNLFFVWNKNIRTLQRLNTNSGREFNLQT